MNNKIKKILAIFLILSLINGMFAFADEKFVSEINIVEVKNIDSGEVLKNFSIGDVIKTESGGILFDYNKKLKIKVFKNSEFKFTNLDFGELLSGVVSISSLSDYKLNIGGVKINLKNSGIVVEKTSSKINILSKYGINKIFFKGDNFLLLEGNAASINEKNFSKSDNIFSKIEKINFTKRTIGEKEKIFLGDKKNMFNLSGLDSVFLDNLVVFKNKVKNDAIFLKRKIFNSCIESVDKLVKSAKNEEKNISKFHFEVEKKCINNDILKDEKLLDKFNKNIEEISVLKEKYFIESKKNEFLGKKFSFIEKIFYLQENISSADIKNFPFFLDEAKKSLNKENNLKNLESGFILVDGILKNNLKFSFEKLYDFKGKIRQKILSKLLKENLEKFKFYLKNFISFNFNFIEDLLKEKKYKELGYIFDNKIKFDNVSHNDKEIVKIFKEYNKSIKYYEKILDTSKNILHGSAEKTKDLEKIKKQEEEKKKKEEEIKKMLDSFKVEKISEVEITTFEQKDEIIKIFEKNGFAVLAKDIKGFMKGGNLFYVNNIKFLGKKYDLVFNLSNSVVSKIKGENFDGEGSMDILRFKNLVAGNDFKKIVFNAEPEPRLQDIEEKDFSQEDFLKKELVRKYLKTVGFEIDNKNITKIDSDNYKVSSAKIEEYPELEIGFNITLVKWTVSNISFFKELNGEINVKLAKNLKSGIEKIYGDYLLRNENFIKILSDLAGLGINKKDIFLGKNLTDGFKVYKGFEMSSGDAILSGEYFVKTGLFSSARFTLQDHIEDFKNVSVKDLTDKIKFINKNIKDLEKLKSEEELARIREEQRLEKIRILNYGENVPDELLDGDWITD